MFWEHFLRTYIGLPYLKGTSEILSVLQLLKKKIFVAMRKFLTNFMTS